MVAIRVLVGLALVTVVAALAVSGGSGADSVHQRYLPDSNSLRTVVRIGDERTVVDHSLGRPVGLRRDRGWLARSRPLGDGAPTWARHMYLRSLLVLRALTDSRTGAAIAGARDGWAYVWPRDASTVAMALAAAGYRTEARRIVHFLLDLDLEAAARFYPDGASVEGRAVQGDAVGWVTAAARAVGLRGPKLSPLWRDRADYQEGDPGNYLGNAVAATAAEPKGLPAGVPSVRRPAELEIRKAFGTTGLLVREADDQTSGADSAAAWAVRPFGLRLLYPAARRTLLRIAANSSPFGIVPSEDWDGGGDPWTAPTAWTAWSLTALGERREALRLMAALRRDATPAGLLPERVDAQTGIPTSTTPLAWSHAFAILAIRQLWP
jgi:Glycosyl hydrolases family 15